MLVSNILFSVTCEKLLNFLKKTQKNGVTNPLEKTHTYVETN